MTTSRLDFCDQALQPIQHLVDWDRLQNVRQKANKSLQSAKVQDLTEAVISFPKVKAYHSKFQDVVEIGEKHELNDNQQKDLLAILKRLCPWRKGPFSVFGELIDSEWKSHHKWRRLKDDLPDLHQKRILDIGSNNGYYLFRMAQEKPQLALGLEPNLRYWLAFQLLHSFVEHLPLQTELMGWQELLIFPKCFDVIFCMGILYHHSDPICLLRTIHSCLAEGGTLIVETAGIEGQDPVALFPEKYYAGMSSWFYPTASCLKHWIQRAGFKKVEVFDQIQLTTREQRSTQWAKGKSLADSLMPNNHRLTIEGYLAPMRFCAKAQKN